MYSFFGYIGIWYLWCIPMYPECMVLCTYIGNVRFRALPMYCYFGFSRRYIGIEISMPIPMYVGPNLSIIYIGMGQHRLFPMYRQISPFKNTSEFRVFIQSRCISINFPRLYFHPLEVYPRASQPHLNFPRCCLYSLVGYSRASGSLWFARRCASDGIMWHRGLLKLIDFEGWIHRDCYYLYDSDVFLYFSDMNSLFSVEFVNP